MKRSKADSERQSPQQARNLRRLVGSAGVAGLLVLCVVLVWKAPLRSGGTSPPEASAAGGAAGRPAVLLKDVTERTGITFTHTHGGTGQQYIIEAMTAGLAVFDYDNDGDEDIYFLNGAPLPLGRKTDSVPANALYRNEGNWHFVDVTDQAGVGHTGYGLGVAAGDYDNDGDLDLYLNNFGPNVLYRNNGDGTFTDVTDRAGVADGAKVGAGACFLDIDGDGDLDLYSANYVEFAYELSPRRIIGGYMRAPSPLDFIPVPDTLFRNNGDGTFSDVTESSGVGQHAGTGMGLTTCDYDNDGDTDIFICNDVRPNFLWQNDGHGHFQEMGLASGAGYDYLGKANGSMGADAADYDNDGWLDIFMTSYQAESPVLYRNLGGRLFEDVSIPANVGDGCLEHVNWGCGFGDFDNDGYRSLFVANGHLEPFIERIDPTTAYRVPNTLLLNKGKGRFVNVSRQAGDGLAVRASSRGAALEDMDNDGDLDVVILNAQDRPTLLRNDTPKSYHWIQLRLAGTHSNRGAVGARVKVVAGSLVQIDEVHGGRGYQSFYGARLHFGLGPHERVDRIEIHWVGGGTDVLEDVPADQCLVVVEGRN
ncbi:MAG TPA: CRTAC1 family protein [Planctomycetaceae bacterium]|nr:CRTAC1 family protein [Planctomycetaceae bacterium]